VDLIPDGGVKGWSERWSEGVRCERWSGRKKRRSEVRGDSDRRSDRKSGK
jgi:hypothetical protein